MRLPAPPEIRRLTDCGEPAPPPGGFRAFWACFLQECVDAETKAATSWICFSLSDPLNAGIGPPPTSTWWTTIAVSGFSWSRFGPTVPVAPAAFSVWQPPQPAEAKTSLPAAGSPCAPDATVVVAGVEVVCPGVELDCVVAAGVLLLSAEASFFSAPKIEHGRDHREEEEHADRHEPANVLARENSGCASGGRTSR